jgi:transglutaminase-like putative cysteine protease
VNKNLNEDVLSIGTSQKYSTAQTFYMKAENLAGSESDTATPIYVTFDKTFQFNYVNNDPLYGQVDKLVDPTNPEIKSLAGKLQFKQDSESCWLAYKNSGVTFEITNNSASSDSTRTVSQIFENGTGNTKDWARVAASTLIAMGVDAKVKSGTVSCNKYGSGSNYNTWWVEFSRQNGDKMETYVTANLPFKGVVYMTKKDFQDAKF